MRYYLEVETEGVVPEEDWIKVFRTIKDEVVGSDSFIKIEFGEVDDDGYYSGDTCCF